MTEYLGLRIPRYPRPIVFERRHYRDLTDKLAYEDDYHKKLLKCLSIQVPFEIGKVKFVPAARGWLCKSPRRTTHRTSGQVMVLDYDDTHMLRDFFESNDFRYFRVTYPRKRSRSERRIRLRNGFRHFWFGFLGIYESTVTYVIIKYETYIHPSYPPIVPRIPYKRQSHGRKTTSNHALKQQFNYYHQQNADNI